jgi:hypothetical protein
MFFFVVVPRFNWKGCRLSWTALPYARLKEGDELHPQVGLPSLWWAVVKINGEKLVSC